MISLHFSPVSYYDGPLPRPRAFDMPLSPRHGVNYAYGLLCRRIRSDNIMPAFGRQTQSGHVLEPSRYEVR